MSIVLKFGGSSVADAACIRRVAQIAKEALGRSPVVVLSAMGKTTDALFAAAQTAERGDTEAALVGLRDIVATHGEACSELWKADTPSDLD
ncbi:MAG: aspartate kinase, partial [Vicinamibacteria bacterium]|nr:aspartate kinase [Vicinamibacteria bacterium]